MRAAGAQQRAVLVLRLVLPLCKECGAVTAGTVGILALVRRLLGEAN